MKNRGSGKRARGARRGAIVVGLLLAAGGSGSAQEHGELQGRVVAAETGEPVAGAVVSLDDLERVVTTGRNGGFVLPRVPTGERALRVEAPGYAVITTTIPVPAGRVTGVTFRLEAFAGVLEELLVTSDRSRERGEAVGRLDSLDVEESLPRDGAAAELIGGGIPGATVLQGGSQPGAGYRILLRGVNSVTGSNDPLIYVDGIRLTSGQAGALIAGVSNRSSLDFLDPSDIARVEVVRGPSASARFGMQAAGGLILIYTKRGGEPPPD